MNITDNCLYTNNTKQPVGMRKNREEQYLKTVSIPRPRVTFKTKTKTLRIVFQNFQDQDQDNNLQEQYTTLRIVSQTVSRPRPRTFKTKAKILRIMFQDCLRPRHVLRLFITAPTSYNLWSGVRNDYVTCSY